MKYLYIYDRDNGELVATIASEHLKREDAPNIARFLMSEQLDVLVPSRIYWVLSVSRYPPQSQDVRNRIKLTKEA